MKRLVMDLDGTITHEGDGRGYADKLPNLEIIARMQAYRDMGFTIIIQTARNMRSFDNSIGRINAHTLPVIIEWLRRHDVPYDEIHVGKPWCGTEGFYVDDRAIRPAEFLGLDPGEIAALIGRTSAI
ncbi:capsule biosynthesis phosphatase [Humitalea rosea]|uniref:Capsule biosynthesis phosphatase n=1 Tax=Humitalea rosea TaxID=990373 RepID=A0A2W7JE73_9PROT|nr:capsular biosynthesis protein [Humitalea rosea]PZW50512.1 capsule biosynthesis phosphatase [Humitalea rosea]